MKKLLTRSYNQPWQVSVFLFLLLTAWVLAIILIAIETPMLVTGVLVISATILLKITVQQVKWLTQSRAQEAGEDA